MDTNFITAILESAFYTGIGFFIGVLIAKIYLKIKEKSIGRKSSTDFEKKVRAKFKIT